MAGATDFLNRRSSDVSLKKFLDLEDAALQQIVAALSIEDRKNVALTCKTLCAIVRSQWRTLLVNILDESDVPPGIAHFRSLETVIWDDGNQDLEGPLAETDWETNPSMEPPEKRTIADLSTKNFQRVRQVTNLVSKAVGAPRPATVHEIELDHDPIAKRHRQEIARRLKPVHDWVRDAVQHMEGIAYEDQSLADHFATLDAANVDDIPDVFAPAPDSPGHDGGFHEQQHNGNINNNNSNTSNQQGVENMDTAGPSTSRSTQISASMSRFLPPRPLRLIITAPLLLSGINLKHLLYHARPILEYPAPPSSDDTAVIEYQCDEINACAHPLPLPYSDIDLGWWEVDGHLPVQAVRGTASWCYHSEPFWDQRRASDYIRLRALRICARDCEVDYEETSVAFSEQVLPHLNSNVLPMLRELHIGRPFSFGQQMQINCSRIQLPQLTRLVLNEMVYFEEFNQLTHLSSLRSLAIAMPAAGFEAQPQDLSSLSKLRDLRSLKIEYWEVDEPQDVAALQQLTELELEGMEGRVHLCKPTRPMPKLAGVALTRLPRHQDMRYREDSKFARWGLRHATEVFPNVEVLHLGTLGSAPASVSNDADLIRAAEYVDNHVQSLLATAGAHGLQYLQLDTVLNIMDDSLDKRCETGSVTLEATVEVPLATKPDAAVVNSMPGAAIGPIRLAASAGASNSNTPAITNAVEGTSDAAPTIDSTNPVADEDDDDMEDGDVGGIDSIDPGSGPIVLWERTVEFVTCEPTEVLVAEFHYRKIGSGEEIDGNAMC